MVWFFERAKEVARLQTTFDNETREYVLTIEVPNVATGTERFTTQQAFAARLAGLEQQFKAQKWVQRGEVEIIDDGWRGPTTRQQ